MVKGHIPRDSRAAEPQSIHLNLNIPPQLRMVWHAQRAPPSPTLLLTACMCTVRLNIALNWITNELLKAPPLALRRFHPSPPSPTSLGPSEDLPLPVGSWTCLGNRRLCAPLLGYLLLSSRTWDGYSTSFSHSTRLAPGISSQALLHSPFTDDTLPP